MPLYEYRCAQCGEEFEKLVRSFFGSKDVTCPACGSKSVERLISVFGLGGHGGDGGSCGPTTVGG